MCHGVTAYYLGTWTEPSALPPPQPMIKSRILDKIDYGPVLIGLYRYMPTSTIDCQAGNLKDGAGVQWEKLTQR